MSSWGSFRSGKWEEISEIGFPKYVLFSTLTFAPIFFIGMQIIHLVFEGATITSLLNFSTLGDLAQGFVVGIIFGVTMWFFNMWMYKRS
jgi:hypothetical protein